MTETAVTRWFGPHFAELHPLLQALHRQGGRLSGRIEIGFGPGLAGWAGRRLARRLGLPADRAESGFTVEIRHEDGVLHWDRRFENGNCMVSRFRPVGTWPDGYWLEETGQLRLRLTVDIVEGGWHWRPLGLRWGWVPLPLGLVPRSLAYKRIEGGRYRFEVAFTLPVFGRLLRYGGLLDAAAEPSAL
jgi:hypothetical protein